MMYMSQMEKVLAVDWLTDRLMGARRKHVAVSVDYYLLGAGDETRVLGLLQEDHEALEQSVLRL